MHLYGSSRLGIHNFNMPLNTMSGEPTKLVGTVTGVRRNFTRGNKLFELSNHLGNILATIADQKTSLPNGIWVAKYQPLIVNTQDYYAFGMQAPFSEYNAGAGRYRYGFNGKENDSEVKGSGNQQDYGMRIYDPRLGRFLSVDPIIESYPMLTPFQFASNRPIDGIDLNGLEFYTPQSAKVTPLVMYDPVTKRITSIDIFLNYQNIANGLKEKVHEKFKLRGSYFDDDIVSGILLTSAFFEVPGKQKDLADGLSNLEGDKGLYELNYVRPIKSPRFVKKVPLVTQTVSNALGKSKADKASAIIEITGMALEKLYDWFEDNVEIPVIEGQAKFTRGSLSWVLQKAIESKLIPNQFLNSESLTGIAEYLVSGKALQTKRANGSLETNEELLDVSKSVWRLVEFDRAKSKQKEVNANGRSKTDNTSTKTLRQ
jgi:RHS repeat-associated protein